MVKDCLECIFDENEVYEDMSKKELDEFIRSMNTEQFAKVQEFFDTMPKVRHIIKVTNPKTEVESDVTLKDCKVFRLTLSHDSLEAYYRLNFSMAQHYNYSLTELDEMLPWEREIYLGMLQKHIEEENEKMKRQQSPKCVGDHK